MPLDNKKEQERAELHRVIWNIANDLRGLGFQAVCAGHALLQVYFGKPDELSQ